MTQSKNSYGQKSQSDLHSAEGHKDRTDFKTIMTVTEENKSAALYSLVCMDGYLHTTLSQSYPPSYSTFEHSHTYSNRCTGGNLRFSIMQTEVRGRSTDLHIGRTPALPPDPSSLCHHMCSIPLCQIVFADSSCCQSSSGHPSPCRCLHCVVCRYCHCCLDLRPVNLKPH